MADIVAGSTNHVTGTAQDFAARLGLSGTDKTDADNTKGYVHATALLRLLREFGLVEEVKVDPAQKKKGARQATVWKVPSVITINLTEG